MRAPNDLASLQARLETLSLAQIEELRQRSGKGRPAAHLPPLVAQERPVHVPLSFAQERLWFLDQLGLVGPTYNMVLALRLHGIVHRQALERSFADIVLRHEVLRTRFASIDGSPVQVVEAPAPVTVSFRDLSSLPNATRATELERLCDAEAGRRFDLSKSPLICVTLLSVTSEEHVLLVTMHHVVSDGWSLGVMMRELSTLYAAHAGGLPSALRDLSVQYADFALWQRRGLQGELLREPLAFWKKQLEGAAPQLDLPTDRPRPPIETFRGARVAFELSASVCAGIATIRQREGVTTFMVLLAAFQVLLSRLSGQEDILLGTPIAGRRERATEDLIGFFVNTLVLRTQVRQDEPFRQLLARVKQTTLAAYEHQEVPFELLVKELRPERDLTRQPLFQVMLALQNYPEEPLQLPGIRWEWIDVARHTSHFDLTLHVSEQGNALSGAFAYASDLFDAATIERMATHLSVLLKAVIRDIDRPVGQITLLDEAERQAVCVRWNATAADYDLRSYVHHLVEAQALQTPNAAAVVMGEASLSYAELNARSNQLARFLKARGVQGGGLVALCMERSVELIVGVLGILKAGGAYVPLDPQYPPERLRYMLEDAAPPVVLTHSGLRSVLPSQLATLIALDEVSEEIDRHSTQNLPASEAGLSTDSLVYVIYTSGSTGRPKGTAMRHRSMVNLIEWHREMFPASAGKRVLQFAALSFDVAFQEIFSTLSSGATLVLLDEWTRRDARALTQWLNQHQVHRLFVPPLMLQSLAESFKTSGEYPRALQDVITAGEQLRISPEIISLFHQLPGCRLHNHYGPTETHVVTALTLAGDPQHWPSLPAIGQPISNTQIYVLDALRQPVPIGVAGEIYIGGVGVARGYLNRPELTKERFVSDPFNAAPDARLYRTGDLGRWRADGVLEYLGRNDDQVKIRGYRIELGEIEAQIARDERVKEAAVVVREDGAGEKCLVAYLTSRGAQEPTAEELREHLKGLLPQYMIPAAFVLIDRLPLTPSGKLDRRALPPPDEHAFARRDYEPPQGAIEETLSAIWKELLRLERIGRHDNFFELGGHSLHGMKLIAKVSDRLRVSLSGVAMFQYPTIQQMAQVIASLMPAAATPAYEEGSI